jgi:class 3 adenylate cyclase/tetratricopeptide (TPR) repeat protein
MAREQRKTVTVLFCDLSGSTALGESIDPERLRTLLAAYFGRMKGIVEYHGGSVEKFIGDAVMAVFGVPAAHEDDALRAVRAALEMRDALPELGLEGRIGVMTGEVVTGTEERLATGDAVNVAARLEQAAGPGDVLIGEPTLTLVHAAVDVEATEPLVLKGKAKPVQAFRLLRVLDAPERGHASRFVGREPELALLREAWGRARAERCCELVTVSGEAGVGKTRLAAELLGSIDATICRGTCPPYGEGITYWPVVEVLKELGMQPPDPVAAAAISSLLRESDAPTSAEEIAWAFRKTLEHVASTRPLAVLFDDVQWGEDAFRDLIEHVALLSSGAPILLLCLARPELGERHPAWPVTLRLTPLDPDDVDALIPEPIGSGLRSRIATMAGGNPLFVQEMVAMAEGADDDIVVPPTLRALLAARLDQLDADERRVLERGAVEGEAFHRGAVQALSPDDVQVTPRLASLVRKQLITPDRPLLAGEDGLRFRHLLIRDVAYEALPKAIRADLHARYAAWLEEHGDGLVELDEILGYHLEQAHGYSVELGLPDTELASAARRRLTAAGRRASLRQDFAAAINLLERAASLGPPGEIDVALTAELAEGLFWQGSATEAIRRADLLVETAKASGDRVAELCGRVMLARYRCFVEPEGAIDRLAAAVDEALPTFEAADDQLGLYLAWFALGHVWNMRGRMDASLEAYDRAATHARAAGLPDDFAGWRASKRHGGTTHASELLSWLDEHEPRRGRNHWLQAWRAAALAMLGRTDEARDLVGTLRSEVADRGGTTSLATMLSIAASEVELVAGDYAQAAELAAEACRLFESDEKGFLYAGAAETHAQALYGLDRLVEAETWARRAEESAGTDELFTLGPLVRAKVLARSGHYAAAIRLARDAVGALAETDLLNDQGNAFCDLAEVLLLAGEAGEAVAALEQALERYDRKGNVVSASRTRLRLAQLEGAAAQ